VIVLVAHDMKKSTLVSWVKAHKDFILNLPPGVGIGATHGTAEILKNETGLSVDVRFNHGPAGGDAQIGAQITQGKVSALIFFWDPLSTQPHAADVQSLLRLATLYNIPLACNPRTADLIGPNLFDLT